MLLCTLTLLKKKEAKKIKEIKEVKDVKEDKEDKEIKDVEKQLGNNIKLTINYTNPL